MTYKGKILPLVTEPDPLLHLVSQAVTEITPEIQNLIDDMIVTMYENDGVGLAAIQVGAQLRIIVMDTEQELITLINPEIVEKSPNTIVFCEGCLSLPSIKAEITRHESIVVKFSDRENNLHTRKFTGLSSVCIQHEIDHLNGIIFLDYLSKLKRGIYMKKLQKFKNKAR